MSKRRHARVAAVVVADDGTVVSHHQSLRCAEQTLRAATASWRRSGVVVALRVVGSGDAGWAAIVGAHPEWEEDS